MVRKSELVVPAHVASFQLAHRSGVRIAAGADSGTPLNFHGSLLPELALMVKYGMTPLEAIRSATTRGGLPGPGRGDRPRGSRLRGGPDRGGGRSGERIDALVDLKLVLVNGRAIGGV